MERALLATVGFTGDENEGWSLEDTAVELEELSNACLVEVVDHINCVRDRPTPNFLIGRGKAEEIAFICQEENIDVVIFSSERSGTQQRNLEEVIGKKTIDRTQLILDIFARRAKSPEGKLQVELAQLQYMLPRLIGKGLILSRTGGGIGTSGPGEQALEIDRRRIREKLDRLKNDLKEMSQHRATIRKKRKENSIPQVALVGYTNAGKSTLLNAITQAGQTVENSLFKTLDPLSKSITLPDGEGAVLSDTVGFLHDLPHNLIEAFKATLEEATGADLLIHVLDVSHPRVHDYALAVQAVLNELGVGDKPTIVALNKIDLVEDETWLNRLKSDFPDSVAISAKFGTNTDILLNRIADAFGARTQKLNIHIPHSRMDLVDLFYRQARVDDIQYKESGIEI
ncbi:MAG: GTPase HflX, partial [Candidatus Omnitrophica bacterium]|nr:GTPase HflX [Candidatus Omnitrophota bacterium]